MLYWIKVVRVGILVLFLILEEMLSAFHHWVWCICGLYYVDVCSLYTHFVESFFFFIINGGWVFSKAFSVPIEMIIWFLFFNLLMCITLIDLWILNHPCIPGISPSWSWCMILLMYYWIRLLLFCWGFLYLCSSMILVYNFLFLCDIFVWFWHQGDATLVEWVWKCFFLCNCFEEFEKDGC